MSTYVRAKNLLEFARNLTIVQDLERDADLFYVPIYENTIKLIRQTLITSLNPTDLFFATGQQGTGKTTALNRVPNSLLEEQFTFIHIKAGKTMNLDDLDIIDLLLFIGFEIIEREPGLEELFYTELDEIQGIKDGTLEKIQVSNTNTNLSAGAKVETGVEPDQNLIGKLVFSFLKLKAEIFGSIKIDREFRNVIRKRFVLKKYRLVELINKIIAEYEEIKGKNLVLIIDDLEKMKDVKQMKELFINNLNVLDSLKCRKILTYPIHLSFEPEMRPRVQYRFVLRIKTPPSHRYRPDKEPEKNRELLKEIAYKRLENKEIITSEALDLAIEYSGGIIRQFIQILWMAVNLKITETESYNGTLQKHDIEKAIKHFKREYSNAVIGETIEMLKYIADTNKPPKHLNETFIKAVLGTQVLVYFNDNTWYDVNPLVKEAVEEYI